MQYFIGIDVSKNDFYACFNDKDTPVKFSNDHSGISQFITLLKNKRFAKKNTAIGIESTGKYHLPICILCSQNNYLIKIINPIITRRQTQTSIRGVKNDKIDSKTIRLCLIKGFGYEFKDSTEDIIIKNLIRQRYALIRMKTNLKLKQQDIEYKENYLQTPITNINAELELILKEKIDSLEKQLERCSPNIQAVLQSIPGIGKIASATLISEIGYIEKFSHPKQLVGYIGVDPRVYESGTSVKGRGYITKRGNKLLRQALFTSALVAIQRPNIFREFYLKKVSEGKPKKVALVAVMRKMIHVIFAVWSRQSAFIPN